MNRLLFNRRVSLEDLADHNSKYLGSNSELPSLESLVILNRRYIDSTSDFLQIVKINQKTISDELTPSKKRLNLKRKQQKEKAQLLNSNKIKNKLKRKKILGKFMSQVS